VSFLDDLKREAEAARLLQTRDGSALQRSAALADIACKTAERYFISLAQQLEVLRPSSPTAFALDRRHVFTGLRLSDFKVDSRRKAWQGLDVFDHVVMRWQLRSNQKLEIGKDFPPDIDKLESRLRQSAARFDSEAVRHPDTGKLQTMRYRVDADFHAHVLLTPEHAAGTVQFQLVNLDGFETVTAEFPAFEIGSQRLDELAKWLVGQAHSFLDGAQNIRRVDA
jgi:hypothetical protein